ncbi:MAG TPA: DUF6542 domain-containing protein [Streptosporangiaceae bacterium]|nr:DUF6542 domain-containing protein [Streptosporangiaceae bacterium]
MTGGHPVRLTGRGAVVGMVMLFAVGLLASSWLGWTAAAGVAFLLGTTAAARYTSPASLLVVVVSPPALFFVALLCVTVATAGGGLSVVAGCLISLAAAAPWLFLGMAACLLIAWRRGLPQQVGLGRTAPGTGRPAKTRP